MYSCPRSFPIFVHLWLKTDLAVTIQSLTLSCMRAESLYKTNIVIKVNPLINEDYDTKLQ